MSEEATLVQKSEQLHGLKLSIFPLSWSLMHDVVMFCAYMQNVIVHTLCGTQSFPNTQCIRL